MENPLTREMTNPLFSVSFRVLRDSVLNALKDLDQQIMAGDDASFEGKR
jgi:hypothetical protein